jgi:hypothetical protein
MPSARTFLVEWILQQRDYTPARAAPTYGVRQSCLPRRAASFAPVAGSKGGELTALLNATLGGKEQRAERRSECDTLFQSRFPIR